MHASARIERSAALEIHLLGHPRVLRDGQRVAPPRGHKVWGLLAYLLGTELAPTREHMAGLLFADADDPLAALRWNLSALRRLLGDSCSVSGDPIELLLAPGALVDVRAVASGSPAEALALPGLGFELLEGTNFGTSAAFEIWLLTERRHLLGLTEAVLREAALEQLAAGEAGQAADLAARLVGLNPLEENFHALLVRSLAAAGKGIEAAQQVARCRDLFRRELGVDPSAALAAAAATLTAAPISGPGTGHSAARAQLEAGEAAIRAGALEAGLQCLRRAVSDARAARSTDLEARALVTLGASLVHAARGRDEEGAGALHEAIGLAEAAQLPLLAAAATRELAYIEFLRGRYERAESWLAQATAFAQDNDPELARIMAVLGSVLTDTAHYERAIATLHSAETLASGSRDPRHTVYTLSMLGRAHLLRGELDDAIALLGESIELARGHGWTAFVPWPEALRADAWLARGEVDEAAESYENAFALGCQLGDPCWEGVAARGLGLVAAARGATSEAMRWLTDAEARCTRLPDGYLWVKAYVLDALCSVSVREDLDAAPWIDRLESIAGRHGMRELTARAYAHRGFLGDGPARIAARALAGDIDNPLLLSLTDRPLGLWRDTGVVPVSQAAIQGPA